MESPKIQGLMEEIKLFPYLNKFPKLGKNVFLAPGSKIVGEVEIGNDTSIWYNTVIRGDVNFVTIGKMSNVQDSSTLHVTNGKFPLTIGDKVTIGHAVVLHGCILKNLCLIGMRSVVLDGAVIEEKGMVAAGSVVVPGFVVPSGKLVAGVPGKVVRDLSVEELDEFEKSAERYVKYTELTLESLRKAGYE
jgi:carbonic anhydrase/acetyltransferase-like protein (isoleucine patch superfamily)